MLQNKQNSILHPWKINHLGFQKPEIHMLQKKTARLAAKKTVKTIWDAFTVPSTGICYNDSVDGRTTKGDFMSEYHPPLTEKQAAFARYRREGKSKSEAARMAGYLPSSAAQMGAALSRDPRVKALLEAGEPDAAE